jgi:hypothetical protein
MIPWVICRPASLIALPSCVIQLKSQRALHFFVVAKPFVECRVFVNTSIFVHRGNTQWKFPGDSGTIFAESTPCDTLLKGFCHKVS